MPLGQQIYTKTMLIKLLTTLLKRHFSSPGNFFGELLQNLKNNNKNFPSSSLCLTWIHYIDSQVVPSNSAYVVESKLVLLAC